MTIDYQDSDIIILNNYIFTGNPDGYFVRAQTHVWEYSTIGTPYKILFDRRYKTIIQIENEFYDSKYSAIESLLVGDVLILGLGLATLDQFLVTGTNWKWVDRNSWLVANISVVNGTTHEGNAEDIDFLTTLGTFDTILIDFPQTQLNDYSSLLNFGGTIIEMTI